MPKQVETDETRQEVLPSAAPSKHYDVIIRLSSREVELIDILYNRGLNNFAKYAIKLEIQKRLNTAPPWEYHLDIVYRAVQRFVTRHKRYPTYGEIVMRVPPRCRVNCRKALIDLVNKGWLQKIERGRRRKHKREMIHGYQDLWVIEVFKPFFLRGSPNKPRGAK